MRPSPASPLPDLFSGGEKWQRRKKRWLPPSLRRRPVTAIAKYLPKSLDDSSCGRITGHDSSFLRPETSCLSQSSGFSNHALGKKSPTSAERSAQRRERLDVAPALD